MSTCDRANCPDPCCEFAFKDDCSLEIGEWKLLCDDGDAALFVVNYDTPFDVLVEALDKASVECFCFSLRPKDLVKGDDGKYRPKRPCDHDCAPCEYERTENCADPEYPDR